MPNRPLRVPSPESGITRIAVAGFKSIDAEQQIEVAPLTLLAGANSAGKSSIMQPLLLWKQTLEAPFDPGPLLLNGPCVRFTSAEQFLSGGQDRFEVGVDSLQGAAIRMAYGRRGDRKLEIKAMSFRRSPGDSMATITPSSDKSDLWNALRGGMPDELADAYDASIPEISARRSFAFLELSSDNPTLTYFAMIRARDSRFLEPAAPLIPNLQDIVHVPGLRGNPERAYQTTEVGRHFPGTFEPYVASLIQHWQRVEEPRFSALVQDLRTLGLTPYISAEPVNDTEVQLRVGRLPAGRRFTNRDLVNIADVGFGVSQTLPVLVALRAADAGRLIYIEQPELHLHPRAQAAMASTLVGAARRGVRVVAETHSAILLRSIQTAIALGEINEEDVSLNWFARDPETGATSVSRAALDADGAFGDWPEDFDDVALEVEGAYLDAVEARIAR
jgi:hypothetical protein